MRSPLRTARVFLSVYYAFMNEYRGEIFLWAIVMCLPLIMLGLWHEAGLSGAFPLDNVALCRYFIACYLVRQLSVVWVIHEFDWYIVSGQLSPYLLQPVDLSWRFVSAHLAEQASRFPFGAAVLALAFWLFPEALWGSPDSPGWWLPSLAQFVLGFAAIYLGFALRFLMQYSLAMAAFWVERASSFERLLYIPYLFLSGMIAPIEVYTGSPAKDWVREIALWTPFPYFVWFPARLLVDGQVPLLRGFATLLLWTVVFFVLSRLLWSRGLKRYSAMGA